MSILDKILSAFKPAKPAMLPIPEEDRRVKITWLPNPVNNPSEKSCYIGMEGIAKNVYPDGSFELYTGTCILLLLDNKYTFKYLH